MLNYYDKDFDDTPANLLYWSCFVQYLYLCVFATFTWLVYEYCITLDKEIKFFWGRRPNGGSLLFFTSRYLPLLARAVDISGYTVKNEPR
ncbi:hypothetical protein LXA43DRAFT_605818 [Ganoderma leucocontextum]|nr:hypothetical protein LXA43DRAFT_605818 [Ganoderma leucocontextum]